MAIPLSERTIRLAMTLFDAELAQQLMATLISDVRENIPFCENSTPPGMERIRFAILKLIAENPANFDVAIDQAKKDWRDLFLAAGFGSPGEHDHWYSEIISRRGHSKRDR